MSAQELGTLAASVSVERDWVGALGLSSRCAPLRLHEEFPQGYRKDGSVSDLPSESDPSADEPDLEIPEVPTAFESEGEAVLARVNVRGAQTRSHM